VTYRSARNGDIVNSVSQEQRGTGQRGSFVGRTGRFAAVLAMTVVAGLAVTAAPAQAAIPDTIVNSHTSRCLADSFASGLQTLTCVSGEVTQRWVDRTPSAPTFQFKNVHTGRCLSDSFGGGLTTSACVTGESTQEWEVLTSFPYKLRNEHTGRCLADSFGGGLQALACASPTPNTQLWV
jgi:Ricin-type beta-trefoil lectin domain